MPLTLPTHALSATREPFALAAPLPAGYAPLAVVPLRALSPVAASERALVLATREIDWAHWQRFALEHERLDGARFERLDERLGPDGELVASWVPQPESHAPHLRWLLVHEPHAALAGRGEDGSLYRLDARPIDDVTTAALDALRDDGEIEAEVLERFERDHYASKLGGYAAFSQAPLRAFSGARGAELGFLAQLRGDVAFDPFGYTYYLFGEPERGDFAVTFQR